MSYENVEQDYSLKKQTQVDFPWLFPFSSASYHIYSGRLRTYQNAQNPLVLKQKRKERNERAREADREEGKKEERGEGRKGEKKERKMKGRKGGRKAVWQGR